MPHVRSPLRLDEKRSALMVVDLQEKLCPVIPDARGIESEIVRMMDAAAVLSIPAAATVQYPRGLGNLVPALHNAFPEPEEKGDFSAAVCRQALDTWLQTGRDQIVICGIETHICILQTVLDLLAEKLHPFVAVQAVGSRNQLDHELALQRMRDCGATLISVESVLFEWLQTSNRPEFKSISQLVKSS
jgi:nicotinamidase-related amidase